MTPMLRTVVIAILFAPLGVTAQSQRPPSQAAPIQCETLATPESGIVEKVAVGPRGLVAWTDGPRATSFQLWGPGQPVRSVSRDGSGPGELRLVSAMGWRADTLWVTDTRLNRVTSFVSGRILLRSIPLPSRGSFVARDDSSFVGAMLPTPQPGAALGAGPLAIGVVFPASGRAETFLTLTAAPPQDPDVLPALKPASGIAANRDASRWCAMANGKDGGTQLACVTGAGTVLFQTTIALAPHAIPSAVLDEEVAAFARRMGAPISAVTDEFSRPRSTSAAFALLVNGTADVWLLRSRPAESEAIWDRVGFDGKRLTPRRLAGRLQLRAVDGSTIYAAETDRDGLQSLVRCRLAP